MADTPTPSLPTVEPLWCVSTAHLNMDDRRAIGNSNCPGFRAERHDNLGAFFYCHSDMEGFAHAQADRREFGCSEEMLSIFQHAHANGIVWILFDVDGAEVPEWPAFE